MVELLWIFAPAPQILCYMSQVGLFWSWISQTVELFLKVKGSPSSGQPPCKAKELELQDLGW